MLNELAPEVQEVKAILEECFELFRRKDHDYSNGVPFRNFLFAREHGERPDHGVMTRLSDKFMRVCSLVAMERDTAHRHAEVSDESMEDTLKDIINYAAIMIELRRLASREGMPR